MIRDTRTGTLGCLDVRKWYTIGFDCIPVDVRLVGRNVDSSRLRTLLDSGGCADEDGERGYESYRGERLWKHLCDMNVQPGSSGGTKYHLLYTKYRSCKSSHSAIHRQKLAQTSRATYALRPSSWIEPFVCRVDTKREVWIAVMCGWQQQDVEAEPVNPYATVPEVVFDEVFLPRRGSS